MANNAAEVEVTLAIDGLANSLTVYELTGTEALSALFELELVIKTTDGELAMETLVGKPAALTIAYSSYSRTVHGMVRRFKQGKTSDGKTTYYTTLVPRVWALSTRKDSRIFQKTDVKTVISTILAAHGFESADYLLPATTFSTRDVIVQYRETDWAFLNRLMEEEGIHYYFEHGEVSEKLVMSDGGAHDALPFGTLDYDAGTGALQGTSERVTSFTFTREAVTTQVTTWDVEMKTPSTTAITSVNRGTSAYDEIFDHQPAQSAANQLAALTVGAAYAEGTAATVRMAPGGTFALDNHPRADFDGEYLVTKVVHDYDSAKKQAYTATFSAIQKSVPWKPAQTTPRPSIVGPQAAVVVGRSGLELDTDKYGRVLVRMLWDRNTSTSITKSAAASYEVWAHVAQIAGGGGAMFVPRAGTHVLVEFLGGDPDLPVIVGRFYSDQISPPYLLPDNARKSTIRSKIYGKNDEYNELTFDDDESAKQVYLRAQRSLKVDVGTATEASVYRKVTVYGDDTKTVRDDEALSVGGKRTVSIGAALVNPTEPAHDVTVTGDESIEVTGDQDIAVDGARSLGVGETHDVTVAGNQTIRVGGAEASTIAGNRTTSIGGSDTTTITSKRTATIGSQVDKTTVSDVGVAVLEADKSVVVDSLTIQGSQSVSVSGNRTETIEGDLTQTVDGNVTTYLTAYEVSGEQSVKITSPGEVRIESTAGATKVGGSTIYLSADSNIEIRSATSISLVIGSMSDNDAWSRKLTLDEDGIYVSNGTVKQKLTGSTIRFNC